MENNSVSLDSINSSEPQAVMVRLYETAEGWRYSSERLVLRCGNGDLDLNVVKSLFELQGDCEVSTRSIHERERI